MKTQIILTYNPDKDHVISRVLPLSNDGFVVLTRQSDHWSLNIHGSYNRKIDLPKVKKTDELNSFCSLFRYKDGFGLAERFGRLTLFPTLSCDSKSVQIKQPYSKDSPLQPFLSGIFYRNSDDSFVLGIEDELSHFFPAKFWTSMKIKNKKVLGFNLPQPDPVLDQLRVLALNKYPPTSRNISEGEWLSIQTFAVDASRLLIHTNGGTATRRKSGPEFEFSIISEFDKDFQWVDNHMVKEGKVFFDTDKKYFIIVSRNDKKLFVYDKENYQVNTEISLTPKQNLGTLKTKDMVLAICGDYLYLYGREVLNICKMLKETGSSVQAY